MNLPSVTIKAGGIERIVSGHVWIYRADVAEASGVEPGAVVRVVDRRRRYWGQALYSSQSQIALRLLTREARPFDQDHEAHAREDARLGHRTLRAS